MENIAIHENISFIINSNKILMNKQYNLIKYAIEQLKENFKKQRNISASKELTISIYDINSNIENKLVSKNSI